MDTEFELEVTKKVKTKNFPGCFEINSMFRTSVHNIVRVIEGKIV